MATVEQIPDARLCLAVLLSSRVSVAVLAEMSTGELLMPNKYMTIEAVELKGT